MFYTLMPFVTFILLAFCLSIRVIGFESLSLSCRHFEGVQNVQGIFSESVGPQVMRKAHLCHKKIKVSIWLIILSLTIVGVCQKKFLRAYKLIK